MSTAIKENLDERIERIRKRNEEIEKKYREAEEDRLMALKENAMVKTKAPKDEDWPKAHKFDNLDFTYDVNPEKLEEHNKQQVNKEEVKSKRDYKKFAEGEGPPPDPAYNFLADAERDGEKPEKKDAVLKAPKEQTQQQAFNRRGGQQNNSFRGRNPDNKTANNSNPKFQKQHSQPEYEQWRSERKRIDDARISRQKVGDKWKREWDNDKMNSSSTEQPTTRPERAILGDPLQAAKISPTLHNPVQVGSKQPVCRNENPLSPTADARGNITVSISQGEVKSVKLTSAPAIGTGRVGPRQVTKPQFQIQAFENDLNAHASQVPKSPRLPQQQQHQPRNNHQQPAADHVHQPRNLPKIRQQQPITNNNIMISPKSPVKARKNFNNVAALHPTTAPEANASIKKSAKTAPVVLAGSDVTVINGDEKTTAVVAAPIVPEAILKGLAQKPEFAKKSVQDRLLRIRKINPETGKEDKQDPGNPILACN